MTTTGCGRKGVLTAALLSDEEKGEDIHVGVGGGAQRQRFKQLQAPILSILPPQATCWKIAYPTHSVEPVERRHSDVKVAKAAQHTAPTR